MTGATPGGELADEPDGRPDDEPTGDGVWGRTVLLTRDAERGRAFATQVRARGGYPLLDPLQTYGPPASPQALAVAVARLAAGELDWLVLTSARAVDALVEAAGSASVDVGGARVAAVGAATAARATAAGMAVELVPERASAAGLLAAWPVGGEGERVLLPLSALAPDTLVAGLSAFGLVPERVEAYSVQPQEPCVALEAALASGALLGAVVTSGSTARRLADITLGRDRAPVPVVVAIGDTTAQHARDAGLTVAAVAPQPDAFTLVMTLADALDEALEGIPAPAHPDTAHPDTAHPDTPSPEAS
ncbi:uroporphyrinogen-III synthase [Miniimonas sp. S16]|uniref:uroporphyrinogen-III synthase n=1 Tax=Miniimonas sp. S16 TaxID=2171623 RepID=UPI000D5261DD|nr:uroporphyrinogen-III synthase [Miniimonas sp. S16]